MRAVLSISSSSSGGRIDGMREASMVLPEPGGPIMSSPCLPAAAICKARLAKSLPATSLKSRLDSSSWAYLPSNVVKAGSRKPLTAYLPFFISRNRRCAKNRLTTMPTKPMPRKTTVIAANAFAQSIQLILCILFFYRLVNIRQFYSFN